MPSPPPGYEGLAELQQECWRCLASVVYMASAQVPRVPTIGNSPGVLDDIRYFLETLLSAVSGWTITSWVRSTLLPITIPYVNSFLISPIRSWLTDAVGDLAAALAWPLMLVSDQLSDLRTLAANIWHGLPDILRGALIVDFGVLTGPIQAVSNVLTWLWQALPSWIRDPLTSLAGHTRDRLWSLEQSLGGYIASLRAAIITAVSSIILFFQDPLAAIRALAEWFKTTFAGHLLTTGLATVAAGWNTVIAAFMEFRAHLNITVIALATEALKSGKPFVDSLFAGTLSIPSTFLEWAATACGTDLALQPARALASVGSLYGMSIIAGTTAMGISTILNLIPTLNWVGAAQLAGLVAQVAAFGPLTGAAYGTLINDALTVPLRYHWNQTLRPSMPGGGDLIDMGRGRALTRGEWQTAMEYQGLPNWWIDKIHDSFWREPSVLVLLRMGEACIPRITDPGEEKAWLDQWLPDWRSDPLAWPKMKMMMSGYSDMDIPLVIDAMHKRGLIGSVSGAKTAARAMMHEAYWTEADAAAFLAPLDVRPEEIHLLAIAEDLDYQKLHLDDQVTYYLESFRKGAISEQDLSLALSTIYVRPERAAQIIARELIRKLPAPKSVTAVKEDPNITRLRTQAINSWISQYHAWEISEQDLLLGLTIVTQDPDLAQRIHDIELTRFRPVPPAPKAPAEDPLLAASRRQATATWVTAYRDGEINADELELYLEPLVTDAATRKNLVQLERLRYSPTPDLLPPVDENDELAKVRAEYVRGHLDLFAKRLITIQQLYSYLQADGLVEPLARATVISQATKRIRVPGVSSPYFLQDAQRALVDAGLADYEAAYMTGLITIEQYTAWLATLTKDQDVVTYLADVLTLRKFTESV